MIVDDFKTANKAWPAVGVQYSPQLIRCLINGVEMVSFQAYHAEITPPTFKFMAKHTFRNLPGNALPTIDFKRGTTAGHVYTTESGSTFVTGAPGADDIKISTEYADYYRKRYPAAQWFAGSSFEPVQIVENDKLIAVIMPLKG